VSVVYTDIFFIVQYSRVQLRLVNTYTFNSLNAFIDQFLSSYRSKITLLLVRQCKTNMEYTVIIINTTKAV